jgi:maleylacetate reductase
MIKPGTHHWNAQQRVVYGKAAAQGVDEEVSAAKAERVLVATTRSLTSGALVAGVMDALGSRCVGKFDAISAHTPRESVLAGAEQARSRQADLIVAIGGGSVIDCAKAMLLCLWRDIRAAAAMDALLEAPLESSAWDADPQRLRMMAVPTTLSAAEFSTSAGVTDVARHRKQRFNHPLIVPRSVVLDPVATLDTPQELFLSSGMRAMDHAVERWLSIAPTPYADAVSSQAMGMLVHALPAIRRHPEDLQARLEAQMAAWLSTLGEAARTSVGASHGLGYILGAVRGVPHGITSCITLPAVLAWNEPVNGERQQLVSAKLGSPERRACDAMRDFIAALGVPYRLRDVGITQADLADLASRYDGTGPISTNPRPVRGAQDLIEILELAL